MQHKVVIKFGGHAMDNEELAQSFADDLYELKAQEFQTVLVHGGGPQINSLLTQLHIESHFHQGLRVTTPETMQIVEMVLTAQVNKSIVARLLSSNIKACGLSGRDGNMIQAHIKSKELGLVGEIDNVDVHLLKLLLQNGYLPVIAPVANAADYTPLNINADTAAGAIAGKLAAEYFVLISDVPGVLDQQGKLLTHLTAQHIQNLLASEVIHGGMIPKVTACLHALHQGAGRALILDGRQPQALKKFLLKQAPLGTLISEQ
ncbi:MAG: acetylglutamate kinase [Desulfovibrio sp.]|nr:acetylglutamate kinase [Desulfovibrio sp.]